MTDLSPILLSLRHVEKHYPGSPTVEALRGVDLDVRDGEFVAVMGPSGCGKSTLLHLAGAMDRPSNGRVSLEGRALATATDDELTRLRRERIGFVFQFFNLLPTLTVGENVGLPLRLAGVAATESSRRAAEMADRVGLSARLQHYPQQLSGGEMQRTAIARALVHRPRLLVADEPTGNLDSVNGAKVLALLQALNRETGVALLLATHAADVAAVADRTLHMRDGVIARIEQGDPIARTARVVV